MSHTPILVFCLGSRALSPLGGGNVAALQHEGRVGSVRPRRSFRAEGRCSRAPLGSHRPSSRASGVEGQRRGGRRGGLVGQRDSLHCSCCAEAAREVARGPWHEPRRRWLGSLARGAGTGRGAGSGRVGTPGHLAGVPAPRAGIRLGRPVRTELGATPGRLGGSRPAGSWSLNARTPCSCSAHGQPSFRVAPTRVASQGRQPQLPADEEVGEGGWPGDWGRGLEAPGWVRRSLHHSRPVEHAQAVPDKAGNFPTWWGKHQNKRPSGAGARPPQPAIPSTRPLPVPTTGQDLGRPLRGRAAGI